MNISRDKGKVTMEMQNNQKVINKMALVNSYILIITLNMNTLDSSFKRNTVAGCIAKNETQLYAA